MTAVDDGEPGSEPCVLVEVEFGHERYLWFPGMSNDALESWWRAQESAVTYWFSPTPMPEETRKRMEADLLEEIKAHSDLALLLALCLYGTEPLPGRCVRTTGQEYRSRKETETCYELLLHMDDDSVLVRPDGSYVFHAGRTDDNLYLPGA